MNSSQTTHSHVNIHVHGCNISLNKDPMDHIPSCYHLEARKNPNNQALSPILHILQLLDLKENIDKLISLISITMFCEDDPESLGSPILQTLNQSPRCNSSGWAKTYEGEKREKVEGSIHNY